MVGARTLALLAVPVLLTGCAGLVTPIAHSTGSVPATVHITEDRRGVHGMVAMRDVIRYVRVTAPDIDLRRVLEPDGRTELRLPAGGAYVASAWSRMCGTTCDNLRSARQRCETSFTATVGRVTDLTVRFPRSGDCEISVGA